MSRARVFQPLSIVVPAYRAAHVISATLTDIVAYCDRNDIQHDITVVNDGSDDGTPDVVATSFPEVEIIRFVKNQGKGAAVRAGMDAAPGAWVLFTDADNSTSIDHLDRFAAQAPTADVIIASRRLEDSRIVRPQPRFRQALGRTFPHLVRWLVLPDLGDTQCGFKLFRRDAAHELAARQTIDRFAFDVELLVIARALGYRIADVPVDWNNPSASTLRIARDAPRMLWDLARITYRAQVGAYSAD